MALRRHCMKSRAACELLAAKLTRAGPTGLIRATFLIGTTCHDREAFSTDYIKLVMVHFT
jgi:hypothetical protein